MYVLTVPDKMRPLFDPAQTRNGKHDWVTLGPVLTIEKCAAWIDALKSGDYLQGNSKLRDDCEITAPDGDGIMSVHVYCCLGVLGQMERYHRIDLDCWLTNGSFLGEPSRYLPHAVQATLANMNDANEPFDTIAEFIRENVLPWLPTDAEVGVQADPVEPEDDFSN